MFTQAPKLWESPQWMPSRTTVDFGEIPPGIPSIRTLTIANVGTGNSNMDVTLTSSEGWLSFETGNAWGQTKRLSSIEGGEAMSVNLRVDPDAEGLAHGKKTAKIYVETSGHPIPNLPKNQTLEVVAEFLKRRHLELELVEQGEWETDLSGSQRVQNLELSCRNVPIGNSPSLRFRLYENENQPTLLREELIEIAPPSARTWLDCQIGRDQGADWLHITAHTANRQQYQLHSATVTVRDKRRNVLPASIRLQIETVQPPLLKMTQEWVQGERIVAGKTGSITLNLKNAGFGELKIDHIKVHDRLSQWVRVVPGYGQILKAGESCPVKLEVNATDLKPMKFHSFIEVESNHRYRMSRRRIPIDVIIFPAEVQLVPQPGWAYEIVQGKLLACDLLIQNVSQRDLKGLKMRITSLDPKDAQHWIKVTGTQLFDLPKVGAVVKVTIDPAHFEPPRTGVVARALLEAFLPSFYDKSPLATLEIAFLIKPKTLLGFVIR